METLIDTDYLNTNFDISKDVIDKRLESRIGAASRRLRKWVGDDVYQSVLSLGNTDGKRLDFQLAEGNLAMHFAIIGLNAPITPKGVVKSSKAEDNAVLSYFTPNETAQLKQMFLDEADEIIRPYLSPGDAADIGIIEDGGCDSGYISD